MTPIPTERLEELIALGERATPRPWVARPGQRYVGVPNHMSFIAECRDQNGNWTNEPMAAANAAFIAAAGCAPDIARELLAAREALTPKPIDTAPKDGTKILLLKIAGHPSHPTALWWCVLGFWSDKWKNWNDGIEPCGLADPNYWMPAPSLAALLPQPEKVTR